MDAGMDSMQSPTMLPSDREAMAVLEDTAQMMGMGGEMSQGAVGAAEVSIKMLMSSKDVGSIIGKGGMTIKAFRESSGARINISNSTSSERLVQIVGGRESISKAFSAIGKKIEMDAIVAKQTALADGQVEPNGGGGGGMGPPQVTFKLVIPSSQCGSVIGKGGSKIKEIRETTGASIQVAGETLPNSTERAVTITGSSESLTMCINQLSAIIFENPAKGPHVPYKPHSLPNQAYQPRANPAPGGPVGGGAVGGAYQTPYTATFHPQAGPATSTQQMKIPNNLIGCIIGRKGSKINEIRVNSGAQIKIAGNEGDSPERLVTITGTPEAVGIAQYLISSRIHSEVNNFMSIGSTATNLP